MIHQRHREVADTMISHLSERSGTAILTPQLLVARNSVPLAAVQKDGGHSPQPQAIADRLFGVIAKGVATGRVVLHREALLRLVGVAWVHSQRARIASF